jgi:Fur family peroxide stress response transcriptional regulator
MQTAEKLTNTLQQAGLRLTPQRIAICQELTASTSHPTAAAIFQNLRGPYPSLSLMTVYNTLKVLVELGAVKALGGVGDDNIHYDGDTSPHINLACVSCYKIIDIPTSDFAHPDSKLPAPNGYKVLGASLMYYGLCPDCQNK